MNYCGFNIEPFYSEDQRRPQTLAEICRNMGICCGFRAMAARDKYPGFILLSKYYIINISIKIFNMNIKIWCKWITDFHLQVFMHPFAVIHKCFTNWLQKVKPKKIGPTRYISGKLSSINIAGYCIQRCSDGGWAWIRGLTHCGLVTPFGSRDQGQHWLR